MNETKLAPAKGRLANHAEALPHTWRGLIMCFAAIMLAAWWGFGHSTSAILMIAICIFYCIMYFGLPLIMFRMNRKALRAQGLVPRNTTTASGFDTHTGWTSHGAAMVQILTVPAALALAMVAIAIVNVLSR